MTKIISIIFSAFFICIYSSFAQADTSVNSLFTQDSFAETWSYSGSKEEARVNFLNEAKAYIEVTNDGEKIEMSYELIITISEVRYEVTTLKPLSDREILIILIKEL